MWSVGGLRRFRARTRTEQALFLEAAFLLGVNKLAVGVLPFMRTTRLLRLSQGTATLEPDAIQARRAETVGWAVSAAAARLPWRSTCLVQALAASVLLRRRGVPGTLHLGVAREEGPRDMAAHAWLRSGDAVVVGGPGHGRFATVATYSYRPR